MHRIIAFDARHKESNHIIVIDGTGLSLSQLSGESSMIAAMAMVGGSTDRKDQGCDKQNQKNLSKESQIFVKFF